MEHKKRPGCGGICLDQNGRPQCARCIVFTCAVCGLSEGTLTTDCPGVVIGDETIGRICDAVLDYRGGAWVPLPCPDRAEAAKIAARNRRAVRSEHAGAF